MRAIREIQTRLELDEKSLRDLLDHGKLNGECIASELLDMVRVAYLAELCAKRRKQHQTEH